MAWLFDRRSHMAELLIEPQLTAVKFRSLSLLFRIAALIACETSVRLDRLPPKRADRAAAVAASSRQNANHSSVEANPIGMVVA
jgi:hypothetical protein